MLATILCKTGRTLASILIFTVGGALRGLGFFEMPITLLITVTVILCLGLAPEIANFTAAGMS